MYDDTSTRIDRNESALRRVLDLASSLERRVKELEWELERLRWSHEQAWTLAVMFVITVFVITIAISRR